MTMVGQIIVTNSDSSLGHAAKLTDDEKGLKFNFTSAR